MISNGTKYSETISGDRLTDSLMNIMQPNDWLTEDYGKLTTKVFSTFKDVHLEFPNYDWYIKTDDDTFFEVDNLREFLSSKDPMQPVTYGYDFKVIVDHGYQSGLNHIKIFVFFLFTCEDLKFFNK